MKHLKRFVSLKDIFIITKNFLVTIARNFIVLAWTNYTNIIIIVKIATRTRPDMFCKKPVLKNFARFRARVISITRPVASSE